MQRVCFASSGRGAQGHRVHSRGSGPAARHGDWFRCDDTTRCAAEELEHYNVITLIDDAMPNPPARFTFLLDPELKQAFEKLCESQDITASQMMRQLIKAHLAANGKSQGQLRSRHRREG
jgi:hypothetical protein